MDRIFQGRAATITAPFEIDGESVQPTSATLGIARADGTELVAAGTSATPITTGAEYLLPADKAGDLDTLTATWVGVIAGSPNTVVTTVEIAGAPYFTVAEARADDKLDDTTKYPTADIVTYRTLAERAVEGECDFAFVPRHHRETLSGTGTASLTLSRSPVRNLRALTVDGTAVDVDSVQLVAGCYIEGRHFPATSAVVVEYEYGADSPPARLARATLLLAKAWLIKGPIDDRATQAAAGDGAVVNLATPGQWGAVFGIPEVDAAVGRESRRGLPV